MSTARFCLARFPRTFVASCDESVAARRRLGIEDDRSEEAGLRFEHGVLLNQRRKGLRGVGNPQSGEDPLPVGDREELEFPRQFDRGGSHATSAVAGFCGDANDANVNISGSSAAGGGAGPATLPRGPRRAPPPLSPPTGGVPPRPRSGAAPPPGGRKHPPHLHTPRPY